MNYNSIFFNNIAHNWNSHSDSDKIKQIISVLNIQPTDSILDVGTGLGVLIPYIRDVASTAHITAIDISKEMLNRAKARYSHDTNISFQNIDIELYKPTTKYNIIILYSVYPHLHSQEKAIKKLYDNLADEGKMIIAHSNSREEINKIHKNISDKLLKSHILLSASKLVSILQQMNIYVKDYIDNEHIYYILMQKKGQGTVVY